MVVFDATTLLYLLDPEAKAPTNSETGEAVTRVMERIAFLVRAGDAGPEYLDILNKRDE